MQTSLRTEDPVNQTDNWQYEIESKAEYDAYRTRLQNMRITQPKPVC